VATDGAKEAACHVEVIEIGSLSRLFNMVNDKRETPEQQFIQTFNMVNDKRETRERQFIQTVQYGE
jgi:hypothetical protein